MDVCVTVPKSFTHPASPGKKGLAAWLGEGDAAGEPWSGQLWTFSTWGMKPDIRPGERVYVVCEGQLRGYAPLVRLDLGRPDDQGFRYVAFIRGGGAMALTLNEPVIGFRGWRYRWWEYADEVPVGQESTASATPLFA